MNRRVNGKSYPQYVWLKGIKDSHKGERCFIVACGPSLTYADLELIKDEYTFGMNSGVLTFDKTGWRPNFYAVQDEYVFNKLQPNINQAMANGEACGRWQFGDKLYGSGKVAVFKTVISDKLSRRLRFFLQVLLRRRQHKLNPV